MKEHKELDWVVRQIKNKAQAFNSLDRLSRLNQVAQALELSNDQIEYLAEAILT